MSLSYKQLFLFVSVILGLTGCAYKWGTSDRKLPDSHEYVAIPVFKNLTQETGIEVSFTNALRQEFERSNVARIVNKDSATAVMEGTIVSLQYLPAGPKETGLPEGTVLASQYRILIEVQVVLKKKATDEKLWSASFSGERTYLAPQVTATGVNTANPLYNLSSRRQNIDVLATSLMSEAHDRITENF